MLTLKGAHLAVVIALGALAATLTRSWVIALAAFPLLVVLLVGLVPEARGPLALRARFSAARPVLLAGDEEEARLVVETDTPRALTEVALAPHPFVEAEPETLRVVRALRPGAPVELAPRLRVPVRGRWPPGELVARERGLGGLTAQETRVRLEGELRVMPRWEEVPPLRPLARRHRLVVGPQAARHLGTGSEFFGLRPYLPGDAIDAVNWRKTAKYGRPIVNEMEQETPAEFVLVLDARQSSAVGAGYHSTLEASVRAVASIAHAQLDDRRRVGLLVLGRRLEWLHPSSGRRQAQRIVAHLLDVAPIGRYEMSAALEHLPQNVLPKGSTAVLVTPAHADPTTGAAVRALLARRVGVVVVFVDPYASELAHGALGLRGEVAARVLEPRRRAMAAALRDAGALVVEWDPREPLDRALAGAGVAR